MHLRGKNIIKPDNPRTQQSSSAKLTSLPDALLDIPLDDGRGIGILSYLDSKDSTHARANLSTSCVTLYGQTEKTRQKLALKQLLQAMLDHYPLKASSILASYPEFLFEKPEDYNIREIESQFTWLRYLTAGESVFSIAQKLLLVDMLKIMFPHYLKQLDDTQHVSDTKHAVLALEQQWILPETPSPEEEKKIEKAQEMLQEQYTRDYLLAPLTAIAADTTIQVGWEENPETKRYEARIEHISPATQKALDNFRAELFKPKTIQDCVDINQLIIATYHAYDSHFKRFQNWHQRDAFAILVIGFIQSLVAPSLGKVYCEDLYGVVYNRKKISPRAESLMLIDGRSFYRANRDSISGQGFNFLCSIYSGGWSRDMRASGGCGAGWVCALENYVKQMYQSVTALRSACTSGTDLTPGHHRS